ncbi:SEC7 [Candida oxycetoniae]|uniref:SEC7 n=1 Tax=Candida oxycetoniae TaxID=497107 RepID=A0AAI9WYI0_9ASCO|nr:SEC7 [Candida oxycetoniae]KAI3405059.2 SEC7 [Candida oxycetoniae]
MSEEVHGIRNESESVLSSGASNGGERNKSQDENDGGNLEDNLKHEIKNQSSEQDSDKRINGFAKEEDVSDEKKNLESSGRDTIPTDSGEGSTGRDTIPTDPVEESTGREAIPTDSVEESTGREAIPTDSAEGSTGGETIPTDSVEESVVSSSPIPVVVSQSAPTTSTNTNANTNTSAANVNATVENSRIFKKSFESILTSKEAKKNEHFRNLTQKALDSLNNPEEKNSQVLFDALKACCETSSIEIKSKAVDLFAKLFDYAQFTDEQEKIKLTNASVNVISACFEGEGTDPELELQVVRALMHSILLMPCHGASLLQAVRQIYNVFIFSLTSRNQAIAQGILTQVIGTIFTRVQESMSSSNNNSSIHSVSQEQVCLSENTEEEKLTLTTLEKMNNSELDYDNERINEGDSEEETATKDAFLVFRAMCKLSVKSLDSATIDMKSHSVRSKLLSLHIIHTILKEHIDIFLSHDVVIKSTNSSGKVRLINSVRQYINLALSKNAASALAPVFELSLEIFWIIISNLRSEFKREIPVFWDEIYFPVAEMKSSSTHQKRYLLSIIERICNDSRCIIEFYLNYDCDSSMPNVCEKIIDYLTKLSLQRVEVTSQQKNAFIENRRKGISVYDVNKIANLTSSTMSSKPPEPEIYNSFPIEYALKMTSISCSVAFLRSMYSWAHKGLVGSNKQIFGGNATNSNGSFLSLSRDRSDSNNTSSANVTRNASFVNGEDSIKSETDKIEQFETQKQRKKALLEGIRQFNQKPRKGVDFLMKHGFIESDTPEDIAKFLLETDGLDKATIGEYLGEGDEKNIAIMHAFVNQMEFDKAEFVDAMRRFLQSFRLPGEAQKIDRFLLKFAERYVMGNPGVFANADTAYILGYSVIMLNTDLHSPQVKNRMTFESFVMNNAGIDDGNDIPRETLKTIYDQILHNEIKLQSEQHAALLAGDLPVTPSSQSIGFFGGRDLTREAYIFASKEMSTKAEKLMKNLGRNMRLEDSNTMYYAATSVLHVKSIFDTLWMSILAGLTPPFKEYDEEFVTKACLEGIKLSIRIACMFDLKYARASFIGALVQFQNLNNYEEMKQKNVAAIHIMLELAVSEGSQLGESWIPILTSISQIERLQLIAQGVDQNSIPDVTTAKLVTRSSVDSSRTSASFFGSFSSQTPAQSASNKFHNQHLSPDVARMFLKTDLEVAIDKVFTNSSNLSGPSIVEFVKALSEVAKEEIDSSGKSSNPRTFSLQKFVDICYYNMDRIRLEWSQLWAIMGETFYELGCHPNTSISFFALDSLRQLSMRFLEIDELAHFKFQKEFLKPFEYVIIHNNSLEVKDMVLECMNNMIMARASQIKSGWKTIFNVCTAAAKEYKESLVLKSYKMAIWINKEYIEEVRKQDSFSDLVVCFTTLAKNEKFQRLSLLSLDVLSRLIYEIAQYSFSNEKDKNVQSSEKEDHMQKLWFPVLFGFHDIIMTGEDLEVRSKALNSLFELLSKYGKYFDREFWNLIFHDLLFPIFSILSNHWELSLDGLNDKLSVWLSTTLIQALKSMISMFTHYFDALNHLLVEYLKLITSCICQENDTIARIGRECLCILLIDNSHKFETKHWGEIVDAFATLFDLTTAKELFLLDPSRENEQESEKEEGEEEEEEEDAEIENGNENEEEEGEKKKKKDNKKDMFSKSQKSVVDENEQRLKKSKEKSSIVVKSVLQLLLIQTLSELFEQDDLYESIPYEYLIKMAQLLFKSYEFAKTFNDNYELRVRLWNAGVIERLPNLLKQESSSSAVFISIMFRMYCDDDKTQREDKETILGYLNPLCTSITNRYCDFDETNQQRNVNTWKPVIIEIYEGYVELDEEDFKRFGPNMYKLVLRLLNRSMTTDLRTALRSFLTRIGEDFVKS